MITKQQIKELEDKQNKIVERYKQLDSSIDRNKVKEYEKLKMEKRTIGGRVCFNDYQAKIKQQDYEEILRQLEEFNKLNPGFEQEYNNWHNLSEYIRIQNHTVKIPYLQYQDGLYQRMYDIVKGHIDNALKEDVEVWDLSITKAYIPKYEHLAQEEKELLDAENKDELLEKLTTKVDNPLVKQHIQSLLSENCKN